MGRTKSVKRKYNTLSRAELEKYTKEQLIDMIFEIRDNLHPRAKKKKKKPYVNLGRLNRHMAFKVAYLGEDFNGFQIQENTTDTISEHIFGALTKCKLIDDIGTANFAVCGRTDKGVSSFGNVFSVMVKTRHTHGRGVMVPSDGTQKEHTVLESDKITKPSTGVAEELKEEKVVKDIDYVRILNHHLPSSIRTLACSPVDVDFTPRHNCASRSYRYFFFRGTMDFEKMREAAALIIGTHDFRNFSKIDVVSMMTWERTVYESKIMEVEHSSLGDEQLCYYEIKGDGFLWHMVRNICAILFLVGNGKERPDIISRMLDIKNNPCKPLYNMVNSTPLVFWDCHFSRDVLVFPKCSSQITKELHQLMQASRIRSAILKAFWESTKPAIAPVKRLYSYNPLFTGRCEESVEKKIENLTGNRKLKYLQKRGRFEHYLSQCDNVSDLAKKGF